ncbi:AraC family transcriptional regulator [Enterovibrio calviensis]|uniref:AraC family transcriptional regulator n=1 Tax=Enterovibrio calviensis TaxID=91359 RepID=UPI000684E49D|nr:AraC family transcriptional regulator [Enterovibrio calviensis]
MKRFKLNINWLLLLKDLNHDVEGSFHPLPFMTSLGQSENIMLSVEHYYAFWENLRNNNATSAYALSIVAHLRPETFSPPLYAALCSANLSQALHRLARFKPLIGPMTLEINESDMTTRIQLSGLPDHQPIPDAVIELEMAFFVHLARMGTRDHVIPHKIESTVPLMNSCEYEAFFGVPIDIGKTNSITFHHADLHKPFLTVSDSMWRSLESQLEHALILDGDYQPFTARVRRLLAKTIPADDFSIDASSRYLAVSRRTLQRRLNDENTQYNAVLASLRDDLAKYYLKYSKIDLAEISFLLGYKAQTSFFRAFQARNKITPLAYRCQRT